jgi:hypothetical protein
MNDLTVWVITWLGLIVLFISWLRIRSHQNAGITASLARFLAAPAAPVAVSVQINLS